MAGGSCPIPRAAKSPCCEPGCNRLADRLGAMDRLGRGGDRHRPLATRLGERACRCLGGAQPNSEGLDRRRVGDGYDLCPGRHPAGMASPGAGMEAGTEPARQAEGGVRRRRPCVALQSGDYHHASARGEGAGRVPNMVAGGQTAGRFVYFGPRAVERPFGERLQGPRISLAFAPAGQRGLTDCEFDRILGSHFEPFRHRPREVHPAGRFFFDGSVT